MGLVGTVLNFTMARQIATERALQSAFMRKNTQAIQCTEVYLGNRFSVNNCQTGHNLVLYYYTRV